MILAGFGSNAAARRSAWQFIKQNWKELLKRYAGGSVGMLGRIVEGSASGFSDAAAFRDAQKFLKSHTVPGIERTIKQTLEVIQSNIAWSRRDREDVRLWLEKRS